MPAYDREVYSRSFARLLDEAMRKGAGDPRRALAWLERKYKLALALALTRHKLETSDAYMDVREHILKRMDEQNADVGEGQS